MLRNEEYIMYIFTHVWEIYIEASKEVYPIYGIVGSGLHKYVVSGVDIEAGINGIRYIPNV